MRCVVRTSFVLTVFCRFYRTHVSLHLHSCRLRLSEESTRLWTQATGSSGARRRDARTDHSTRSWKSEFGRIVRVVVRINFRYEAAFFKAYNTFRYQIVYDPISHSQRPLHILSSRRSSLSGSCWEAQREGGVAGRRSDSSLLWRRHGHCCSRGIEIFFFSGFETFASIRRIWKRKSRFENIEVFSSFERIGFIDCFRNKQRPVSCLLILLFDNTIL